MSASTLPQTPSKDTAKAPAITIDFAKLSEQTVKVIAAQANDMGCTPNEAARIILDRLSA